MKAIWYEKFGEAKEVLKFGDYETPTPSDNEVKVRIYASGVNPSDTKKRLGANPNLLDNGSVIPNSDGAGEIVEVGGSVSADRVGERVWVFNGQFGQQEGTSAEYICIPEEQAVFLPENISYEEGAMMGIPAMTAHRCVTADGPIDGQTVLVTGGSGRVGYYAIQWAKYFGATVIATASSSESAKQCRAAGADLVVDHPSSKTSKDILDYTNGQKINRIIEGDFGVNLLPVLDILSNNGIIATYSSMTDMNPKIPFLRMMFMDLTIRMVLVYIMPKDAKQKAINDITLLLKQNKLDNRVAEVFSLEDSANAHEAIEKGNNFGSVIIRV